ncbi:MAG: Imm10 family immunity protein [Nibricoccus sp.]
MPKVARFSARDFGAYEDHALVVGFARDQSDEESDDALVLQRAKETEEDSGIYAEIPPQRFVTFGGVKEARLARDSFSVTFEPEATAELDGIAAMQISFSMSDEDFSQIRQMLSRIFRDHAGFKIQNG